MVTCLAALQTSESGLCVLVCLKEYVCDTPLRTGRSVGIVSLGGGRHINVRVCCCSCIRDLSSFDEYVFLVLYRLFSPAVIQCFPHLPPPYPTPTI